MDEAPKIKNLSRDVTTHVQGRFVVRRLGPATVNLYTKYEVSMFTHYEDITRGSAMAEGQTDGQTHNDGKYRA